jgi:hypothetical protein
MDDKAILFESRSKTTSRALSTDSLGIMLRKVLARKRKDNKTARTRFLNLSEMNAKFMRANFYKVMIIVFLYIMVGLIFYHRTEQWSFLDCLYFLTITVLTIGYGDLSPTTDHSRIFTAFYILFGVGVCGVSIGMVVSFWQDNQERVRKQRNMNSFLTMKSNNSSEPNSPNPALMDVANSEEIVDPDRL